jgi:hypothetical protein
MDAVDEAVLRILTPMYAIGLFDYDNPNNLANDVTSVEHETFARNLSASSHILLKNERNILPLSKKSGPYKIALLGKSALAPIVAGGGSGSVFPPHILSPYKGILSALNIDDQFPVTHSCAESDQFEENVQYAQYGCQSAPAGSVEECCEKCGSYLNCNYFTYTGGRCNFYPTGNEKRPKSGYVSGSCKKTSPPPDRQCNGDDICVAYADGTDQEGLLLSF